MLHLVEKWYKGNNDAATVTKSVQSQLLFLDKRG